MRRAILLTLTCLVVSVELGSLWQYSPKKSKHRSSTKSKRRHKHCIVSGWSKWSECDTTLSTSRYRHVTFTGHKCPNLRETKRCERISDHQICSDKDQCECQLGYEPIDTLFWPQDFFFSTSIKPQAKCINVCSSNPAKHVTRDVNVYGKHVTRDVNIYLCYRDKRIDPMIAIREKKDKNMRCEKLDFKKHHKECKSKKYICVPNLSPFSFKWESKHKGDSHDTANCIGLQATGVAEIKHGKGKHDKGKHGKGKHGKESALCAKPSFIEVCGKKNLCITLHPCQNGKCIDKLNDYECVCHPGFEGKHCDKDINNCAPSKCQNGGTCIDKINGYECFCTDGFQGRNCASQISPCLGAPCQHNSTCASLGNDYNCTCVPGWSGKRCEIQQSLCASNPCRMESTCSDFGTDFICLCKKGFTGRYCDVDIDECRNVNCNNGACLNGHASYNCVCDKGYHGTHCDMNINECEARPCLNNGFCKDLIGEFSCLCPAGITGRKCEKECEEGRFGFECAGKCDCANNHTCDKATGFCICNEGWEGRRCEIDVDVGSG